MSIVDAITDFFSSHVTTLNTTLLFINSCQLWMPLLIFFFTCYDPKYNTFIYKLMSIVDAITDFFLHLLRP